MHASSFFFFQAEDGIRDVAVTGVQTCALPILHVNGRVVKWGQLITVDGTTGRVLLGAVKRVVPKLGSHYTKLMAWADEHRRLRVRANADTPADAKRAREFGAEGIGLCRTEHMFFEGDRITAMREIIVA